MSDLIDPLNEDTYDHRVIVHGGIKTKPPNKAYERGWERIFGKKKTYNLVISKIRNFNVYFKRTV